MRDRVTTFLAGLAIGVVGLSAYRSEVAQPRPGAVRPSVGPAGDRADKFPPKPSSPTVPADPGPVPLVPVVAQAPTLPSAPIPDPRPDPLIPTPIIPIQTPIVPAVPAISFLSAPASSVYPDPAFPPPVIPAPVLPVPGDTPSRPVEDLLNDLAALQGEKVTWEQAYKAGLARMEQREAKLVGRIEKKLEEQKERLKQLGVGTPAESLPEPRAGRAGPKAVSPSPIDERSRALP